MRQLDLDLFRPTGNLELDRKSQADLKEYLLTQMRENRWSTVHLEQGMEILASHEGDHEDFFQDVVFYSPAAEVTRSAAIQYLNDSNAINILASGDLGPGFANAAHDRISQLDANKLRPSTRTRTARRSSESDLLNLFDW